MIMLHEPHDHACSLAAPMFQDLAAAWSSTDDSKPSNVTFAMANSNDAPVLSKSILGGSGNVPAYALYLKGIATPVIYKGGWSAKSLSSWLNKQLALQPVEADSIAALRAAVSDSKHGLALVGFLSEAQRERRLLEVAARAAQAPGAVVHGSAALADALGRGIAEQPCVLVMRRDEAGWPMLRGPLTQRAVEGFARERVMPSLVAMGDSTRDFSQLVRNHPLQLQMIVLHRSGQRGPHEKSDNALIAMRAVAQKHGGEATFLSYDFFDNDPDAFMAFNVPPNDLPVVLAVHSRGGFTERTWRLPPGRDGEDGIMGEADVERLLARARADLRESKIGKLTAHEQQSVVQAPDDFWGETQDADEDVLDRDEL